MATPAFISVVVPAFNEEECLPLLFERLTTVMASLGNPFEIVVVDDGSSDRTFEVIAKAAREGHPVRGLRLSRNFGQHIAASAGLADAKGDRVVVIGADLQDPPEAIPQLFEEMDRGGWDVVYGLRSRYPGSPLRKIFSNTFYWVLSRMVSLHIDPRQTFVRVMSRRFVNAFLQLHEVNRFLLGMWAWTGFKQTGIPVQTHARPKGVSKYTSIRSRIRLAESAIFGFSMIAIDLTIVAGLIFVALAFVYLLVIIVGMWAFDWGIPGWTSLIGTTILMGGVQITFLGIIAKYIGAIFEQTKGRPPWIVQERIGDDIGAGSPIA